MGRFVGRNVLVTGASTGIGRACAIRFAEEGANIAINYNRSEVDAKKTAAAVHKLSHIHI